MLEELRCKYISTVWDNLPVHVWCHRCPPSSPATTPCCDGQSPEPTPNRCQQLPAALGGDLLPSLHYNLPPSVLHVTLSVLYLTREACSGARQQQSRSKLIVKTARMPWPAPDPPIHIPESLHAHKHPHTRDTSLCHLSFIKLLGKNSIPKNKISLACDYIYSNNLERQTKNTAWHFIQTLWPLLNKLQKLIPVIFTPLTVTETSFACKLFKVF